MTTPPPPQQQQPSQQQLAVAAASALVVAGTVAEAAAILGPVIAGTAVSMAALKAALEVVMSHPPDREGFYGPATARIARLNLMRRAQFLVTSMRRFAADQRRITSGAADPQSLLETMARERRYYGQHMMASWARMRAAAQVDTASMDYGRLLGWYTVLDRKTSPECIAANRHNFYADQMPAIGYPGAVHLSCRCMPGPPVPGAPLVRTGRRVYGRAA